MMLIKDKILSIIKADSGKVWTSEIARLADMETSDSNGGHKNWDMHDILETLASQEKIKSTGGGRGKKRMWHYIGTLPA